MRVVMLVVFWALQALCFVLFKYGSQHTSRFWTMFIAANAVGVTSTVLLMHMYRFMNANIATGLAIGGGFLCSQLALAIIYHSRFSPLQWVGLLGIALGMALIAFTAPAQPPTL